MNTVAYLINGTLVLQQLVYTFKNVHGRLQGEAAALMNPLACLPACLLAL